MAKVITFAIEKGGTGKTTTAAIVAWILSTDYQKKVLVVDLDSQGDLTEIMFQKPIRYWRDTRRNNGVFEAIKRGNPVPYIVPLTDKIDVLPGSALLGGFAEWLWTEHHGDTTSTIRDMLDPVKDVYDYIIIDTPPALGEILTNALTASDWVVILFETGQFCYSSVRSFVGTISHVKKHSNSQLEPLGILVAMLDSKRSDNKTYNKMIRNEYGQLVFDTVVKRQAATGRVSYAGFLNNPELEKAIAQYRPFVEEMIQRGNEDTTTGRS